MSQSHEADVPPFRYTAELAEQIEEFWQRRWEAEGTFHAANPVGDLAAGFDRVAERPKLYVLDMFPYPSGEGLHVGHPLGYIGTDVYARYKRMTGFNVLHTMGYDAFGLPAEQYAMDTGRHPRATTEANIATMRRQLRRLGLGHDARRRLATTDVGYYRWTQWIFLQIFNAWYDREADRARPVRELVSELDAGRRRPYAGTNPFGRPWPELTEVERRQVVDNHRLAYRAEAVVNWCPGLGTVLANEEVTAEGRSDRGNFPVFRKPLTQWMMRITAYADRLIRDLDLVDWPESVADMQRNWIGRSVGALVRFPTPAGAVEVFTTRPDTLFGATYVVLAPEHGLVPALIAGRWPPGTREPWTNGAGTPAAGVSAYQKAAAARSELERQAAAGRKTGVFTGSYATNPANGSRLPIFVADYVLAGYGTGAIMAVPGQDQRDWDFAEAFDLPIVRTVRPPDGFDGKAYLGDGPAMNSGFLDGLGVAEAIERIIGWLVAEGAGEASVTYKLHDWLFSRQRYWGEPFPIVYDEHGLPVAVPESMLPVELPAMTDFRPPAHDPDDAGSAPEPPLSRLKEWVSVELDFGDGPRSYRRETNTMPQWAGSCWYEIRYIDPMNDRRLVGAENERYWMGVRDDRPAGGVDLYVGGVEHAVLHLLYARFWQKVLYDLGHVTASEPFHRLVNQGYIQAAAYTDGRGVHVPAADVSERDGAYWYQGRPVRREYGKMGKSLKNSVTPDEMYAKYGADTLRLYEMFTGPLEQSRPWETQAVVGVYRLLQRVWRNLIDEHTGDLRVGHEPSDQDSRRLLHRTIAAVSDGMETMRFNTAIARITELNNAVTARWSGAAAVPREIAEPLVLLLAPLAPHIAEELWSRLGHPDSLAWTGYPVADPALLVASTVEVPVQINGKVRAVITVAAGADADALRAAASSDPRIAQFLANGTIRRVITVPDRLVNFVIA